MANIENYSVFKHLKDPKLGLIVIDPEHIDSARRSWTSNNWDLHIEIGGGGDSENAMGFTEERLKSTADRLRKKRVDLVIFDAWATYQEDKNLVQEVSGLPVLTGPSLCPKIIRELAGED